MAWSDADLAKLRAALQRRLEGGDMSRDLGMSIAELWRKEICGLCGSKEELGLINGPLRGPRVGIVCRKCAEIVIKEGSAPSG